MLGGEAAELVGADADEQVAVLGDDIGKGAHQFGSGHDVLGPFVAVGTEGMTHTTGGFPFLVLNFRELRVLRGSDVVMVVGRERQRLVTIRDVGPETLYGKASQPGECIADHAAMLGRLDPSVVDDTVRHGVVVLGE